MKWIQNTFHYYANKKTIFFQSASRERERILNVMCSIGAGYLLDTLHKALITKAYKHLPYIWLPNGIQLSHRTLRSATSMRLSDHIKHYNRIIGNLVLLQSEYTRPVPVAPSPTIVKPSRCTLCWLFYWSQWRWWILPFRSISLHLVIDQF